ncbi:MAG: phosphodiesterase [Victivallales bacterium]|nr:phosphodiesterase [Victivallales bacterium]
MDILFFSDLHGHGEAAQALRRQLEVLQPERIVFLGDSLSPLRDPHAAEFLCSLADRITAVAGNCDGDREQAALPFPLHEDYALLNVESRRFFLTHGDRWNAAHLPPAGLGDVLCFGHTHVPMLRQLPDGFVLFNPGSCALPRSAYGPTYGYYDGQELQLREVATGEIFSCLSLNPTT